MNLKVVLAILMIQLTIGCSFGQMDYTRGYIITMQRDTIQGIIAERSNERNYSSCVFNGDGNEKDYYPEEILGFGYLGGKAFTSQIVAGSFVEILVEGPVSLYKADKKFYILKDGQTSVLEVIIEEYEIEGKTRLRYKNEWRDKLESLTSDCLENAERRVRSLPFDEYSLAKYAAKYNNCRDADFIDYNRSERIVFAFGASVGLISSEIQIIDRAGLFPFLDRSYRSVDPSIGILVAVTDPRFSKRISLQTEFHYFKSNYASLNKLEGTNAIYYESHFTHSTLSIPISLKYSFPKEKLGWNVQLGVNADSHFQAQATVLSEEIVSNVVNTLPERSPFEVSRWQMGYFLGVGLVKPFAKFDAGLSLRYFRFSRFNEPEDGFSQGRGYGSQPDDGVIGNINNTPDTDVFDVVSRNHRMVVNLILWRR